MAPALASHPDPFAVVQQDRNGHEHAGEERAHAADPEVAIRRSGEEEESHAEHGTCKVVSGLYTRRVGGICVYEVVQDDVL